MTDLNKDFMIFSVDRGDRNLDAEARKTASEILGLNGVAYVAALGKYKGRNEMSYIVGLDRMDVALDLATIYGQETVLVNQGGLCELWDTGCRKVADLGEWREVSEREARKEEGYTFVGGRYFVTKEENHG